jgi:hypothetical protein
VEEKRVDAFALVRCPACGGELHPVQPGARAPEYYCPSAGTTRELREGDEIVSMIPKAGAGPHDLERGRELLRRMERDQRERKPAVERRAKKTRTVLLWIAAIAAASALGVTLCASTP